MISALPFRMVSFLPFEIKRAVSAERTSTPPGKAKMSGWLYKQKRSRDVSSLTNSFKKHLTMMWSKRFFTIEKDTIKWYTSERRSKLLGFVNFHEVTTIRVANSESRSQDFFHRDEYGTYGFIITTHSRKLILRAEDRFQARTWIEHLRKHLEIWTGRTGKETLKELKDMKQVQKKAEEKSRKVKNTSWALKPNGKTEGSTRSALKPPKKLHPNTKNKEKLSPQRNLVIKPPLESPFDVLKKKSSRTPKECRTIEVKPVPNLELKPLSSPLKAANETIGQNEQKKIKHFPPAQDDLLVEDLD
eukprot:snap_masked-scaffold_22-processed-gene-5.49-mRNA-1 protein AED:1.00 eAED:1.00 QI:0/-1/0/0/-1/1/1/0/301